VRGGEYNGKVNAFSDTLPILVRGALGSPDAKVVAIASTTVGIGGCAAGAATIPSTASIPIGSAIVIGTGATAETHLTTSVSGTGAPYTIGLSLPTQYLHLAGETIAGLTAHTFGVQNDQVGSQPPSLSLQDFDGANAFQILAAQVDELSLDFGAEKEFAATFKLLGNGVTSIATPTNAPGTEHFFPGWDVQGSFGGTVVPQVEDGTIPIKRTVKQIWTAQGVPDPYASMADGVDIKGGKFAFTVAQNDATLTEGTTRDPMAVLLGFTEPQSMHAVWVQMSQVQFKDPKRKEGKPQVQVDTAFDAEANTTDAVSGGYAAVQITIANAVTTTY
jgi:hypothetical protein